MKSPPGILRIVISTINPIEISHKNLRQLNAIDWGPHPVGCSEKKWFKQTQQNGIQIGRWMIIHRNLWDGYVTNLNGSTSHFGSTFPIVWSYVHVHMCICTYCIYIYNIYYIYIIYIIYIYILYIYSTYVMFDILVSFPFPTIVSPFLLPLSIPAPAPAPASDRFFPAEGPLATRRSQRNLSSSFTPSSETRHNGR